ncbi:GAF and ANTAR domain-containing protein [Nocardioides sp.]|uniref:GAF and ANTAR domain-containing protein n=1 Tax=Nocardioides sp. TaxID=35761 RepID=UPI00271F4353|nr:GAF and ANTAR domain-containing protein [Nocardioides sp.]MDO9457314.1 GAF and ANTAR domain-containing protein [Nocardioides sp.]
MPANDSSAFADLASALQAEPDASLTATTIVLRMADLVADADEVSLTIQTRAGHATLAASGTMAAAADEQQYALGEGPCVETSDRGAWIRSGNVGGDPRWPRWGPEARELGVASMLAVRLLSNDQPYGALNLYSRSPGKFADHDVVDLALIYGTHAATALSAAQLATNLQTAIGSRHTIGMAQGIVMERYGLTQHQSFELMRRLSSSSSTKLRDVAAYIVENRELPELPPAPGTPSES